MCWLCELSGGRHGNFVSVANVPASRAFSETFCQITQRIFLLSNIRMSFSIVFAVFKFLGLIYGCWFVCGVSATCAQIFMQFVFLKFRHLRLKKIQCAKHEFGLCTSTQPEHRSGEDTASRNGKKRYFASGSKLRRSQSFLGQSRGLLVRGQAKVHLRKICWA